MQLCHSSGKGLLTPNNPHLTDFNQRVLLERHGQTAGVQNWLQRKVLVQIYIVIFHIYFLSPTAAETLRCWNGSRPLLSFCVDVPV